MEKVSGYVDHIVFRNEDNGYTVLALHLPGKNLLTCVGTFPAVSQGMTIEAEGEYTLHPVYGRQFSVSAYEERIAQDEDAIERYLASGAIKGIKAGLAARIVRQFGVETMRIIEEEPQKLAQVKGISAKKAAEIGQAAAGKTEMRRTMIFLQKYGISVNLAVKIYQRYGERVYQILQENPYQLAEEIRGVGFVKADEIASRIGIHMDSDYRIQSGLLYVLQKAQQEGHIFLPKDKLFGQAERILGVSASYMEKHLMDLLLNRKVVIKEDTEETLVYPAGLYQLELDTARMLNERNVSGSLDEKEFRRTLQTVEAQTGMPLEEKQAEAVRKAMRYGVSVLTGGPGTGKTTTINTMIRLFAREGLDISLAAPTGRAAKRMTEATGYAASTIHRLLEMNSVPEDESQDFVPMFNRNAECPLETDVIIIDEMSMVDIYLMHSLLSAITGETRLVLVGDENQLPSVGPGNVLRDIIQSGCFEVTRLDTIFRQAAQSDIVTNAHRIQAGESVSLDNRSRDFFFLKRYDADHILRVVLTLIRDKLPSYVGASPYELQVLTPMRKGVLGVERLNEILQKFLNPSLPEKKELQIGDRIFREGDKVMQVRNNYQMEWELRGKNNVVADHGLGVFNGDMGRLCRIDEFDKLVTVEFDDGRFAEYSYKQMEELELAYAVTIHKSQGSEYPAVILPLLSGPELLMNRNLLYTAVTRAKKCVAVVGNEETFARMIANERQMRRYSSLAERVKEMSGL